MRITDAYLNGLPRALRRLRVMGGAPGGALERLHPEILRDCSLTGR